MKAPTTDSNCSDGLLAGRWFRQCLVIGLTLSASLLSAVNASGESAAETKQADKAAPTNLVKNAYFGELHLHTAYSLDAYIFGNTMNDPFTAYRFAKGEEVTLPTGAKKRISAPLDFTAITDHAEGLGEYEICTNPDVKGYDTPVCKGIRTLDMRIFGQLFKGIAQNPPVRLAEICGEDGNFCREQVAGPWHRTRQAADENYQPGKFTTFAAFEFSSGAPEGKGGMMHRNVIFRSDKVPEQLFTAFEGSPEQLHAWLEAACQDDCKALTIPHNPNFYWGRLYWGKNSDGTPFNKDIVERRARLDRLVEIMQIKGNSECQTGIMTADEECNFEMVFKACPEGENAGCSNEYAMVRNGLKFGLQQQEEWGVNPFKQGFVGATDNHNGTPGDTAENNFKGHYAGNDGTPEIRLGLKPNPTAESMGMSGTDDPTRRYNPGALTGVWAEENTRESIWDALYRRETFATSGTRTRIRLFAGYDFSPELLSAADWHSTAASRGVPQGGDIATNKDGKAPQLAVWAARDPMSAPLARLQIIKGWKTADGQLKEQTYDIACSDGGNPDPASHRCPDNGAEVDLKTCQISTDKGAAALSAVWTDPDFDPAESAFYYARVLENPVCRWSMYDALKLGVEHPADIPPTVRERAWSSPVWYHLES